VALKRCKICGAIVKPGNILCGDKECFVLWTRLQRVRSYLRPEQAKKRREYNILVEMEIQRATWVDRLR